MDLSNKLVIKARLGDDVRKILVHNESVDMSLDDLLLMMERIFSLPNGSSEIIMLKYEDEDGDLITIAQQHDLSLAITTSRILKLSLFMESGISDVGDLANIRTQLTALRDQADRMLKQLPNSLISSNKILQQQQQRQHLDDSIGSDFAINEYQNNIKRQQQQQQTRTDRAGVRVPSEPPMQLSELSDQQFRKMENVNLNGPSVPNSLEMNGILDSGSDSRQTSKPDTPISQLSTAVHAPSSFQGDILPPPVPQQHNISFDGSTGSASAVPQLPSMQQQAQPSPFGSHFAQAKQEHHFQGQQMPSAAVPQPPMSTAAQMFHMSSAAPTGPMMPSQQMQQGGQQMHENPPQPPFMPYPQQQQQQQQPAPPAPGMGGMVQQHPQQMQFGVAATTAGPMMPPPMSAASHLMGSSGAPPPAPNPAATSAPPSRSPFGQPISANPQQQQPQQQLAGFGMPPQFGNGMPPQFGTAAGPGPPRPPHGMTPPPLAAGPPAPTVPGANPFARAQGSGHLQYTRAVY